MLKLFKLSLLSVSVVALSSAAAFADYQLNILHINDFHSRIEPINKYDATCSTEDDAAGKCFGGIARLKTAIDARRAALAGQNLLTLDAGDNFQGSLFYSTYKGAAESAFLNDIGFDAMVVGNHEFDDGEKALAPFLDKAKFPVLGANVVTDAESTLKGIKPSTVVEIGGQKVGIIGVVTPDTAELASPGPHVTFTDDVAAITAEVEKLTAAGVDKIVALTHVGYKRDMDAIAKIPGVDVVVGGHSHTLLSNTDDKAAGPYPTMVANPGGYEVPVVTADAYGKYLGDLAVTFDDAGVVKSAKGEPILIDASFAADPAITARIAEMAKPIEALKQKVIGSAATAIDGSREACRVRECQMGDLVADALVERTKGQGVTIAITNGGGLRASIAAGAVTQGDVITVLPFQNTVATFQLKGADIRAALENGVSQIEESAGRFPQVAGLKFRFDRSKPAGSRVGLIFVREGDTFMPLDPDKVYAIASNNYMRAGGDGYKVLAKEAVNAYDYGPDLADVAADYIAAHSPYAAYTDGRIVETTPAAEAMPAAPAPAAEAMPAAPAPAREMTHTVMRGESLWGIAEDVYGDGHDWPMIAKANKIKHPNRIHAGQVLAIPAK